MADTRSIVITGASRGLGFVSAARLYTRGWRVLAAMRSPEAGIERLRAATGAAPGDPRLTPVQLDLDDASSIASAAKAITEAAGAPHAVVHNAAYVTVGCVEEVPPHLTEQIFSTNVIGPIRLTRELLPAMRQAGRGRIVIISSVGGIRGMPTTSLYSATKGAIERWGEALAHEIAPFGLGATVVSTGIFRTDVYDENYTTTYADRQGPYAPLHAALDRVGERVTRAARPPERFAVSLEKALEKDGPFVRHAVGSETRMMLMASRLLPASAFHSLTRAVTGLPRSRASARTTSRHPGQRPDHPGQEGALSRRHRHRGRRLRPGGHARASPSRPAVLHAEDDGAGRFPGHDQERNRCAVLFLARPAVHDGHVREIRSSAAHQCHVHGGQSS